MAFRVKEKGYENNLVQIFIKNEPMLNKMETEKFDYKAAIVGLGIGTAILLSPLAVKTCAPMIKGESLEQKIDFEPKDHKGVMEPKEIKKNYFCNIPCVYQI